MLTTSALMSLTPQKVRDRTSRPEILIIKDDLRYLTYGAKDQTRRIFLKVSLHNDESSGRPYSVAVRSSGTKKDANNFLVKPDTKLWVHCSCPYFFYYLEVVLSRLGSSTISKDNQPPLPRTSNKALPMVTNPELRPYICKHIWAALAALLRIDRDKKAYQPLIKQKRKEKDMYKKKADEYGKKKKGEEKKETTTPEAPKMKHLQKVMAPKMTHLQKLMNDYGKKK